MSSKIEELKYISSSSSINNKLVKRIDDEKQLGFLILKLREEQKATSFFLSRRIWMLLLCFISSLTNILDVVRANDNVVRQTYISLIVKRKSHLH